MTSQPTPRSGAKVLGTLFGIVASAALGGLIKAQLDRAKPLVELGAVGFAGSALPETKVSIPQPAINLYARLPFAIDEFKPTPIPLETLEGVVAGVQSYVKNYLEARRAIANVLQILQTRSGDVSPERLRVELIRRYISPTGNILETMTQGVLEKEGYFQRLSQIEAYQSHPPAWRSPGGRVPISTTRRFDLSELVIEGDDSADERYSKMLANVARRLWINLDRNLLSEIFEKVQTEMNTLIQDSQSLERQLVDLRESINPTRIHAVAVVSNFGVRPTIIRSTAYLGLKTSRAVVPVEMEARVEGSSAGPSVVVISGGESRRVDFFSTDTVGELSRGRFRTGAVGRNRPPSSSAALQVLYDSEAMDCQLVMYQVLPKGEPRTVPSRGAVPFSRSANEALSEQLKRAIKKLDWSN